MHSGHIPLPDAADIVCFHDQACGAFFEGRVDGAPPPLSAPLWQAIADNHTHNMRLWAEEDLARRMCVRDAEIVANKRAIDRYNQARNDAIERIDDILIDILPAAGGGGRLNSETPGSMIDRLSIASLKSYHMMAQVMRQDVDAGHRTDCQARAGRIAEQRADLRDCLRELLADCVAGRAYFKVYRQFKMYNDARLNMALVREAGVG